jgi:hypothetical protein
MNPLIRLKKASALFPVVLGCFALSPIAQGQLPPPPPDGGYPGANTAEGDSALFSLTTGTANTAIGNSALTNNTSGSLNTAIGFQALFNNSTGNDNTATGVNALFGNRTGSNNTATGDGALSINTTGMENTATGANALGINTIGNNNTATGFDALVNNTMGGSNTATGLQALDSNTTGGNNTANGENALFFNTTGFNNTAEGFQALLNNRGSSNIAVGSNAGLNLTTGNSNIDIGNQGVAAESATIRIGTIGTQRKAFIAGIHGVPVTGVAVKVTAAGQLGVAPSSARFKEQIKPMGKASEAILALKPVTFRYKHEVDPEGIPQFGLVAEQVEKVNPDLVARDNDGKPYTVRYEAVNAMLLNEFLKEHCKVESLEKAMAEQQKENAAMRAMLKEQAAQIQRVSAQLEVSKSAPQTALNNR